MSNIEVWAAGYALPGISNESLLAQVGRLFPKAGAEQLKKFVGGTYFVVTRVADEETATRVVAALKAAGTDSGYSMPASSPTPMPVHDAGKPAESSVVRKPPAALAPTENETLTRLSNEKADAGQEAPEQATHHEEANDMPPSATDSLVRLGLSKVFKGRDSQQMATRLAFYGTILTPLIAVFFWTAGLRLASIVTALGLVVLLPKHRKTWSAEKKLLVLIAAITLGCTLLNQRAGEAAAKRRQAESAACPTNVECLQKKASSYGRATCEVAIERKMQAIAKYQYRWQDGREEFPLVRLARPGVITYVGDAIQAQNGFGAWSSVSYECDYDVQAKKQLSVRVME